MGNSLFTSVCRREEIVDFEDISDATFDFISVAVHKDAPHSSSSSHSSITTKHKNRRSSCSSRVASCSSTINKIVAVVPVTLEPSLSPRTIVGHAPAETMSFNDRLNMLTWDPETTPLPTPLKHDELYVFDEYDAQPTNTPRHRNAMATTTTTTATTRSRDGWIRRAVNKYQETRRRRRDRRRRCTPIANNTEATLATTPRMLPATTTTSKKRSLHMTLWGKRTSSTTTSTTKATTTTAKDQPYQLPLIAGNSDILDDDDEAQRFLFDQEEGDDDNEALNSKRLEYCDGVEPISDTESDDSGSDATTLCQFYTRATQSDSDSFGNSDNDSDADSDSDWSEWTRSSSTSSCYFSAAEDRDNSTTTGNNSVPAVEERTGGAVCGSLSDYLCECSDCPSYMAIERDVTNSNCWMNETERRALCRVLQAFVTFSPQTTFRKDMIASAEECLLVFQGDEHAAFQAFVMLAQTKW